MRLLFVADHLKFGGAERHLVALAGGLVRRGHKVAVAYLKDDGALAAELEQGGAAPMCCRSRGGLDLAALGRLAAIVDAQRPDVLVATSQYSNMYAALARLRARRYPRLAFICHSMGVVQRGQPARLRFMLYRQFYRMPDCVVFVSELQRDFFAAKGMGMQRAEVIHSGVDLRRFDSVQVAAQAALLRARYGLARDELVLGLCAIFREEKRHIDLLEAVARLRAQGIPARAVLVGDGPLRRQVEAARERLHLREHVILAGYQDDVRPYIATCDVMTLTSDTETFPIATLEYMAFARPVVASDVGGMREQLVHGVNGLLYPAGDIGALTAALARLSSRTLRERLGQRALSTVMERFDEQLMLARYECLFHELARPAASAPAPAFPDGRRR